MVRTNHTKHGCNGCWGRVKLAGSVLPGITSMGVHCWTIRETCAYTHRHSERTPQQIRMKQNANHVCNSRLRHTHTNKNNPYTYIYASTLHTQCWRTEATRANKSSASGIADVSGPANLNDNCTYADNRQRYVTNIHVFCAILTTALN